MRSKQTAETPAGKGDLEGQRFAPRKGTSQEAARPGGCQGRGLASVFVTDVCPQGRFFFFVLFLLPPDFPYGFHLRPQKKM